MVRRRVGIRQGASLVLALALLGVAGYRLRSHFRVEAERGRVVRRARPPHSQATLNEIRVLQERQRRIVFLSPLGDWQAREIPGRRSPASVRLAVRMPAGEEGAVLSVSAGEEDRELGSIACRRVLSYRESPLYMEKRGYVLRTLAGKSRSLTAPCPPLLRGLRAVGAPDRITLMWEPLNISGGVWTKGPEIVVLRIDAETLLATPGSDDYYPYGKGRFLEAARISAKACEYQDPTVQPGGTYAYRLAVAGEVEATVTNPDTGKKEMVTRRVRGIAPVHNRVHAVVATAEVPKPLRIAVATDAVREGWSVMARGPMRERPDWVAKTIREGLPSLPWLLVTMRDAPQDVAAEKTVAAMGQDERGVAPGDLVPAEACLRVVASTSTEGHVNVWLDDYLNGRRLLVAQGRPRECEKLLRQISEALAACFPERLKARVAEESDLAAKPRLAVLAFRPTSPGSSLHLSPSALRSLLGTELASCSRFEVVDREWTDASFAEQERLALRGEEGMGELGQTLGADCLLSGNYRTDGQELVLEACLVDVAHGTASGLVSCRGQLDSLGELARQLETKLRVPRPVTELGSSIPLKLAFDLDRSLGSGDYRERIDTVTLARSRDPQEVLIAAERLEKSDPGQTRVLLRRVLKRQSGSDPAGLVRVASWLDGLLRPAGEVEERITIWRRVLAEVPDTGLRRKLSTNVFLGEALCDAGRVEEARECMQPGPDKLRNALLYERMGLRRRAWEACAGGPWLNRMRIGPGYAGAIFLLQGASGEERRMILGMIARNLSGVLPHQVKRALAELRADGPLPDELWGISLRNAVRLGDETRTKAALAMLSRLPPYERLAALSLATGEAAGRGEAGLAAQLMVHLRAVQPDDERSRQTKEIRIRRGVPKVRTVPARPKLAGPVIGHFLEGAHTIGQRVGDTAYLLSDEEVLVAYSTKTQEILWQLDLDPIVPALPVKQKAVRRGMGLSTLSNAVWAGRDTVYVPACRDGRLLAVNAGDGSVRWSFAAWGAISPPVVSPDGKRVVVAGALGSFLVLDARTGKLRRCIMPRTMVMEVGRGNCVGLHQRVDRDADYERGLSLWVTATRSQRVIAHLRNTAMLTGGGAGDFGTSLHSLNLRTLACVWGTPPPADSKDTQFAKLSDRAVSPSERSSRIGRSPDEFPRRVLFPLLMRLSLDTDEPDQVRNSAMAVMIRYWPSKAVEAMGTILQAEHHHPRATWVVLGLPRTAMAELDDGAVAVLVDLLNHPSMAVRRAAADRLVWALGPESLPHIGELLASPEKPDEGWHRRMGIRMAENGMPEGWALLRSMVGDRAAWGRYVPHGVESWVRALAKSGSSEALSLVVSPFDEAEHLALLSKATAPFSRSELDELAKPYRWIRDRLPVSRYAPFLQKSLVVAPQEVKISVAEALVLVVGEKALPEFVKQDMQRRRNWGGLAWNYGAGGLAGGVLMAAIGTDLGGDVTAWEQEVNRRRKQSSQAGSSGGGE